MSRWTNIKTWNTKRFTVTLDYEWEEYPDLSWDKTGETVAKIESGEWGNYCFCVRVMADGREIATNYLGNSIYADPTDFYREHIGVAAKSRAAGVNYGCYFTDMMHEAIREARKALCNPPRIRCAA